MTQTPIFERWEQLFDFPLYEVSSFGKVRNIASGTELKPQSNQSGILMVALRHHGRTHMKSVSLLVCNEFNGEPPNSELGMSYSPMHIDHDRSNCSASNLVWRPRWYAIKYMQEWRDGPKSYQKVIHIPTVTKYDSAWAAAHSVGMLEHQVLRQCDDHLIHGDICGSSWMYLYE